MGEPREQRNERKRLVTGEPLANGWEKVQNLEEDVGERCVKTGVSDPWAACSPGWLQIRPNAKS